eukprot:5538899-Pyramimonas_sp.AAC.1
MLKFIMNNMSFESETVTESDIEAFRVEMKPAIATAVDPLKDEMADFRSRLAAVELRSTCLLQRATDSVAELGRHCKSTGCFRRCHDDFSRDSHCRDRTVSR